VLGSGIASTPAVEEPPLPPPAPSDPDPAPTPSRRPSARVLVSVLVLAALVRVVAYREIKDSPILELQRWSEADMSLYVSWARAIRAGDWLSRADQTPYHSWHGHMARAVHAASGSTEPFDERVGRRIWRGWLGEGNFYADAGYPYFLAVLGALFGEKVTVVYLVQTLLGLASVALIVYMAQRMFDSTVAFVAGVLAALFGPLIFFESVLLRSVLNTLTGLLAVASTMLALERPSRRRLLWLGLVSGVSFLVQATAILFALGAAALLVLRLRREPRRAAAAVGLVTLAFLLTVSPLIARNVAVGARPLSLPANGTVTFIHQNAVDSEPASGFMYSHYASDIMSRSGGRFWPAAVATVRTHPSLGSWLALCARRVLAFWSWYEIPNNANYYYFCLFARAVCAVAVTFASIGPLAAVGVILALRRGWVCVPALVYAGSGLLTSALVMTLSRLRLPYACALIPFAAFTIVSLLRWVGARRYLPALATAAAVAIAAVVLLRPQPATGSTVWAADYGTGNEIVVRLAQQKAAADDYAGAIRKVEDQLKTEPETLRLLEPGAAPSRISILDAEIAGSFAAVHELAADLYAARQDRTRAEAQARRARVLRVVSAQWESRQRRTPR
jgi:4-amino-4-deoxy-L-arabinose transferase-like glycosyltransferase